MLDMLKKIFSYLIMELIELGDTLFIKKGKYIQLLFIFTPEVTLFRRISKALASCF